MEFAPASKKRKRPLQQHAKPQGLTTRQGHDADDDKQHFNLFKRIRIQGVGGSSRTSRMDRTQPVRSDLVSIDVLNKSLLETDMKVLDILARGDEKALNSIFCNSNAMRRMR